MAAPPLSPSAASGFSKPLYAPSNRIRYHPKGGALELFKCKDPEILIVGPAGTGKSLGCLEKFHLCMQKYPGSRAMFARKTRVSMRQSVLVTWENIVRPQINGVRYNKEAAEYRYPNGSIIAVAGMDKGSKHMSSEWDMIYLQEATEATEGDVQDLTTRLRYNNMPYQQLIMDCNPSFERHFLHLRCLGNGPTTEIRSFHRDNPTLWDTRRNDWTPDGRQYMARLDTLTGARRLRLRDGLWASAEGMVYDEFDANHHVIDPNFYNREEKIPELWPLYWSVDFGYSNPFVAQLWGIDSKGCLVLIREIYMTHRLVEDHAKAMKSMVHPSRHISAVICDHDAEGRATLEKHLGIKTTPAHKAIREGIQAVQARLRLDNDGNPRIRFMRNSVRDIDHELSDPIRGKFLPACTVEEFDSYVWDTSNNRRHGEEPVDRDNHGMDCMRYMVAYIDGVGEATEAPDMLVFGSARGW